MAAPTPTVRQIPSGYFLENGFSSLITLASAPNINFWEKSTKPPGWDGGDAIDVTTMFNTIMRTKAPRTLKDLTAATAKVAYDPIVNNNVRDQINRRTTITYQYPDGSTLAFFGYLQKFEPDDLTDGSQPEATVTFMPTNLDPTTHTEQLPVLTNVAGT